MDELEREEYLLHSRLPAFRRKVENSLELIRQALKEVPGTWAASYSGGKDSTAMIDLLVRAGWRGPVIWQSYGPLETLPDNRRMAEWVAEYYGLEVIEREAPGEFEVYRRVGHFFLEPETAEEKKWVRWWWKQAFESLDVFMREQSYAGHFWGLRAAEAIGRKMMIGRHGRLFQNKKHGLWTCTPMAYWSARDVWAYLVSQNLRWGGIYEHGNREKVRNDVVFLAGSFPIHQGSFAYWAKHYPELFERLAEEWPEIRCYI